MPKDKAIFCSYLETLLQDKHEENCEEKGMKIAVPSTAPDLDGLVEQRLGSARHLLIVESEDMSFLLVDSPGRSGPGAGIAAISAAVDAGARAILAGYVAPHIADALRKQSVDVVSGFSGTVLEAVVEYTNGRSSDSPDDSKSVESGVPPSWAESVLKGMRQLYSMIPRLIGVILLLGLFRGFVDQQTLLELLSGSFFLNAFWGAALGSILVGNPVNSYVIGDSLLNSGGGMAGSVALMMAWVTVGVIHLPLEASALGWCFALMRNLAAFVVAILLGFIFAMMGGVLL